MLCVKYGLCALLVMLVGAVVAIMVVVVVVVVVVVIVSINFSATARLSGARSAAGKHPDPPQP